MASSKDCSKSDEEKDSIKVVQLGENLESCRVCMAQSSKMIQMFDTKMNIVDKIQFCTGLLVSKEDGLPTKICDGCLNDLVVAHRFKRTCLLAEETFHRIVSKSAIKKETDNSIVDGFCDEVKVKDECDNADDDGDRHEYDDLKEDSESESNKEQVRAIKTRKKRGPYRKAKSPQRLRKYKFKRLTCEACGLKFKTKKQSDDHRKKVHQKDDSFVCEICGKVFVHRSSHYTHIRSHLPPQYACEQCDYKTWHKHDLAKHVRIHTGVKQYQCEFCTSSYYTSSNLTCHIRRFHQGVKRFHCHLCDRSFYDSTKLNRHVDSHNNIKRYECEVCHSCFSRRCYWKKHLQKLHGIDIPAQRPGRQKVNILIEAVPQIELGKVSEVGDDTAADDVTASIV